MWCPNSSSDIYVANGWTQPSLGTPDFFHVCSSDMWTSAIPQNSFGFQYPKTGNAYAGFYQYCSCGTYYREYVQSKLLNKLKAQCKYCVEFYVSLSDSSEFAIANIGVHFSKEPINSTHNQNFDVIPQVSSGYSLLITDTTGWSRISGSFIADGDEEYITIGNFDDSSTIVTLHFNPNIWEYSNGSLQSYYYLDDIFVWECTEPVFLPNVFTPNADGVNDEYIYTCPENEFMHLAIYNRWGKPVFESSVYGDYWDGIHRGTGIPCTAGVYYAMLKLKTETIKSALQLFR